MTTTLPTRLSTTESNCAGDTAPGVGFDDLTTTTLYFGRNPVDRHLTLMPCNQELMVAKPLTVHGAPSWDVTRMIELTREMEGSDVFLTAIRLPMLRITSLGQNRRMKAAIRDRVGKIIIHGRFDPRQATTATTNLVCNRKLNTTFHVLSQDFFESITDMLNAQGEKLREVCLSHMVSDFDTDVNVAWSTILWMISDREINIALKMSDLHEALSAIRCKTFDLITWFGYRPPQLKSGMTSFGTWSYYPAGRG